MTRTHIRWSRVYMDGYNVSGYTRTYGPLACTFDEGMDDAINKTVKGAMLGQANISIGTFTGLFDNTAAVGIHALLQTRAKRTVLIAQGMNAEPAIGDPVFAGEFNQLGYQPGPGDLPVTVTVPFGGTYKKAPNLNYARPWGTLLHAEAAATDVNAADGIGGGGQTLKGGFMCYQVLAAAGTGNITAAIQVEDCDTADGTFGTLLTTGTLNLGSGGVFGGARAGIVSLPKTGAGAVVESFVRWQITLTLATSVTFVLSFHRNY